jgi:hypothetical protein
MKRHLALVGAFLGLLAAPASPQSGGAKPSWGDWAAWSAFPEGAWVTIERDFRGDKSTFTQTVSKKSADRLTIKLSDVKKKDEKPDPDAPTATFLGPLPWGMGEEVIEKDPKPFPCPTCRKDHKPSLVTEQKKEKLKIGGKEVLCYVMDAVIFNCAGEKDGTSRWWLSKEVPGGLVKREWVAIDKAGKVIDLVVDFDKKKKVETPGK